MHFHVHEKVPVVIAATFILLIAACGSQESIATDSAITTNSQEAALPVQDNQPMVGTGGELISITSENVTAAGYDAATQVMTVVFDSGGVYEYAPVGPEIWNAFISAQPHPWSAVGKPALVDAGVPYRRLK